MLEKTLESPLDCKEMQPVHPKRDQSWVIGRTDVEAETPILWPPPAKSWLIWIDPDAGRDWGQEEKGTTEDEMVGWHHRLDGQGFEWTPGVGDGQGGLACCSPWGRRESDTTEWLNWTGENLYWDRPIVWELSPFLGDWFRLEHIMWFQPMRWQYKTAYRISWKGLLLLKKRAEKSASSFFFLSGDKVFCLRCLKI